MVRKVIVAYFIVMIGLLAFNFYTIWQTEKKLAQMELDLERGIDRLEKGLPPLPRNIPPPENTRFLGISDARGDDFSSPQYSDGSSGEYSDSEQLSRLGYVVLLVLALVLFFKGTSWYNSVRYKLRVQKRRQMEREARALAEARIKELAQITKEAGGPQ